MHSNKTYRITQQLSTRLNNTNNKCLHISLNQYPLQQTCNRNPLSMPIRHSTQLIFCNIKLQPYQSPLTADYHPPKPTWVLFCSKETRIQLWTRSITTTTAVSFKKPYHAHHTFPTGNTHNTALHPLSQTANNNFTPYPLRLWALFMKKINRLAYSPCALIKANSHVTLPTRGSRGTHHYVTDFCENDINQGYCSDSDSLRFSTSRMGQQSPLHGAPRFHDIDNGYLSEGSSGSGHTTWQTFSKHDANTQSAANHH
ncbi:Protein sickie [Eumeta japonica]|uniref:Protein sickie n=1 Tax=Eumeta variegata TaxID=151549 RepID=A0A4C1TIH6_EUMVA|nr:Protein sickie [Eumeta japonica]